MSDAFSTQLAKHFRDVHFGKNWTAVSLKAALADVTWQQATAQVHDFHTILALTYHVHYFVHAVLQVLKGGPLEAHDKFSFDHPEVKSQSDWDTFLEAVFADAEAFAEHVEQLPDDQLHADMADPKYGSWYRNIQGIIEHTHYHLGQIVLTRKMLHQSP